MNKEDWVEFYEEQAKANKTTLEVRSNRNPHYIGEGKYLVKYQKRDDKIPYTFKGVCENFAPSGLSAFWNKDKEEMLLIHYRDILGLYPIKQEAE